jgi:hypothetical protein
MAHEEVRKRPEPKLHELSELHDRIWKTHTKANELHLPEVCELLEKARLLVSDRHHELTQRVLDSRVSVDRA